MFKRLLSMILALSMVLSACPVYAAAEETVETAEEAVVETLVETTAAETEAEPAPEASETEPEQTAAPTEAEETVPETAVPETEAVSEETEEDVAAEEAVAATDKVITAPYYENVTLAAGSTVSYSFTPTESGNYVFYEGSNVAPMMYVLQNGYIVKNKQSRVEFTAEAGVTYTLSMENFWGEAYTIPVHLDAAVPLEYISFGGETYGMAGDTIFVEYSFEPRNAHVGSLTWTIDDESIAMVNNPSATYVAVDLLSPGTTYLTASTDGGSHACTIVVNEAIDYRSISVGDVLTGTLTDSEPIYLSFEVPEDGDYILWNDTGEGLYCSWQTENNGSHGMYLYDANRVHSVSCTAGETCIIEISNRNGYAVNYGLHLQKAPEVQSITFNYDKISGIVGATKYMYMEIAPQAADVSGIVWEYDEEIIAVDIYANNCNITFLSTGTTTLRATLPNGSYEECVITVNEAETIVCDQPVSPQLDVDESAGYWFTAPETGSYYFYNAYDASFDIELCDENGSYCTGGNSFQYPMEAGEKYLLMVNRYGTYGQIEIWVTKCVPAEGIAIEKDSYTGFVGGEIDIRAKMQPANAVNEELTWTSSDPEVVAVTHGYDNMTWVDLLKAGTATITVTSENGWTDSCTITVKEPTVISAGYIGTVVMEGDSTVMYAFTPEESGEYVFWEKNRMSCDMQVSADYWIASGSERVAFDAEAGTTYYIKVSSYYADTETFMFCLEKTAKLTGMKLNRSNCNGWVGETEWFTIRELIPENASMGEIVWTIDNEKAAQIDYSYGESCQVKLLAEGVATLTATCGDVSASCVITVGVPETISLGFNKAITVLSEGSMKYFFTPEKDGEYVFWNETDSYCNVNVQDENGNWITSGNRAAFMATAGTQYSFTIYNYSGRSATYLLHLDETAPLESIRLNQTSYHGWTGATLYLQIVEYVPGNASVKDLVWEVEDETVAKLIDQWEDSCDLMMVGEGSTKVTATCGDISVSCAITVKEPIAIDAPYSQEVTFAPQETKGYSFTAKESGTYVFWDENNTAYIMVFANGNHIDNGSNRVQFEAVAGQTYNIQVENGYRDVSQDFKLHLDKAVPLKKLTLSRTSCDEWVGGSVYLEAFFDPGNGKSEGLVWTVSDPSVLEIEYQGSNYAQINLVGEGKATITATCGDFSASCTVNAKKPTEISAPYSKTVSFGMEEVKAYLFTPEKSGQYVFWADAAESLFMAAYRNGSQLAYGYNRIQIDAVAGEHYLLEVNSWAELSKVTLKLDEAKTLKKLSFQEEETYLGILESGGTWIVSVVTDPVNADLSGMTAYSSDSSVAAVVDINGSGVMVDARKEGTAIITVECGKYSDTLKVTVGEYVEPEIPEELEAPELAITGDAATGKPVLSWNLVPGVQEYWVYRSTSKSSGYKKIDTVYELSYLDEDAEAGKTYYYKVRAVAGDTKSEYSNVKSRTVDLAQPEIKATVSASTGKVKISWKKISGAEEYKLYRREIGGSWKSLKTTTSTSYTDSSAEVGVLYEYRLKACHEKSTADSAYSEVVSEIRTLEKPDVEIDTVSSTGTIELTWEAQEDAIAYFVYRATAKDGEYEHIGYVTDAEYVDETAVAGTEYFYKVMAEAANAAGNSARSSAVSAIRALARPDIDVKGDSATGKNVVVWEAVEGAVEYKVYRATSKSGTYSLRKTTTELSYTDTSGSAGKTYYYKVKAIHEKDEASSDYSSVDSRTCDLPQPEITLSNTSSGSIKVSWSKISGAEEYKVYRSTDGKKWSTLKTTTSTSYTNTSGEVGVTYYYRVRAIHENTSANSAYSEVKSLTRLLAQPEISVGGNSTTGKNKVSWEAVEDAVQYTVLRSQSEDGEYEVLTVTEKDSYTDTSAVAGTKYYYKVMAMAEKEAGNSQLSEAVSRTCDLPKPVIDVKADADSGKNLVTWEAVEGAEKYEVYRATSKSGKYSKKATVTELSWLDTGATAGKTYYYKVKAIHENSAANSAYSSIDSRMADLPRPEVSVSETSSGYAKVKWAKIEDAKNYKVYRSEDGGESWKTLKTTTSSSYTDKTVKEGKTYLYRVRAYHEKSGATSAYSESVPFGEPPLGSEENPIQNFGEFPIVTPKIKAGDSVYYTVYGASGMILTVDDADAAVTIDGEAYTGGMIGGNPRQPAAVTVTNNGTVSKSFTLALNMPVGTVDNPAELVLGSNTASIEFGAEPYYYTWTATEAGTLTVAIDTEASAAEWMFVVNNLGSYRYGDEHNYASDPLVTSEEIAVNAGDEIQIMVSTYNPEDMWSNPAGDVVITASFQAPLGSEGNPIQNFGEFPIVTPEIAAGETLYYSVYGAVGMVLTADDADAAVTIDGEAYTGGAIEGIPRQPVIIAVTNNGSEAKSFTLALEQPKGTWQNPDTLTMGENTATVSGGEPYYYTWIAPADGVLTLTIGEAANGWQYQIENKTTGIMSDLYDHDYTPDDTTHEETVSEGDELVLMVGTYDPNNWSAAPEGTVTFTASFALPAGSEANPIALNGAQFPYTTDAIAPGETVYYMLTGIMGQFLVVEDEDAAITVNGQDYDGSVINAMPRNPAAMTITNKGAEAKTFTLSLEVLVGTIDNPDVLALGDNMAKVGTDGQPYYYTWTAPIDGVLTLSIRDAANGWQYQFENKTSGAMSDLFDHDYTPDDTTHQETVSQGDVLVLMIGTYDPDNWSAAPEGSVIFTVSFEAA